MTVEIHPAHPLSQYRGTDVALAHFKNLLKARTDNDGSALPGWRKNVDMLRTEIMKIEGSHPRGAEAESQVPAPALPAVSEFREEP